jgi:uncharacterized protein (UPF0276 family)
VVEVDVADAAAHDVRREPDTTDRFGLTWQPALAAGILANFDRIDVVEVIAEEQFGASSRASRALETLACQVPLLVHGVALGPASTTPIARNRLDKLARFVDRVKPAFWSEHLACVRAGDIEIGHLAAAPRTSATIEATAANLDRAASVIGSRPMVENISTLMDPPGSDRPEVEWVSAVAAASDCDLLLDLHNVYANSLNFGFDPIAYIDRLDPNRIGAIHLAGGCWIEGPDQELRERRYLDDHLHDVPDPVYTLLVEVGARVRRPLTVILERDGRFPSMRHLLWQLDRARAALAEGRCRRLRAPCFGGPQPKAQSQEPTRERRHEFETFLARLYTDAQLRRRFLADPRGEAERHHLTDEERTALERIDRVGLEMSAQSFAHKRAIKDSRRSWRRWKWR